jgi:transposase
MRHSADAVGLDRSAHRRSVGRTGGHGPALRSNFANGGTETLKASVAPGPPAVKSETALRVVTPLLEEPVANRPNWTIARMRAEIEAREGVCISRRSCPRRCEKKFRYRRPRHTLKGRQVASEVDRIGLRLQLRERQAAAGDIVLLYGDENEALTHPYRKRSSDALLQ